MSAALAAAARFAVTLRRAAARTLDSHSLPSDRILLGCTPIFSACLARFFFSFLLTRLPPYFFTRHAPVQPAPVAAARAASRTATPAAMAVAARTVTRATRVTMAATHTVTLVTRATRATTAVTRTATRTVTARRRVVRALVTVTKGTACGRACSVFLL